MTPSPFDSYCESQIIEVFSSAWPPDPLSAAEELSSNTDLWSRDCILPSHHGFLAHRGQSFNLLDPAGFLSLDIRIDTDASFPGGAHTFAGPNVIDRAEPCQWTNDDGWDASLLLLGPQHS